MEEFKHWVKTHKALAIGGGIALVVLLYLWLRSGSSAPASNANAGLQSYYAAEAASTQGAAAQVVAQDQLQAAENQTNVAGAVAQAQIAAQNAPYQAQIDELTQLANLQAYQDYLGASSGAGTSSTTPATTNYNAELGYETTGNQGGGAPPAGTALIWNLGQGSASTLTDPTTGQVWHNAGGFGPQAVNLIPVNYNAGVISAPTTIPGTTTTTPPPAVVQPGSFNGFSAPTL